MDESGNNLQAECPQDDPILIVDDDDVFRRRLGQAIERRGHRVLEASCADDAMMHVRKVAPPRAVIDLRMPGASGLDLIRAMRDIEPGVSIVVLTGYGSITTVKQALQLGVRDYLTKPADADQVLSAFDADTDTGNTDGRLDVDSAPSLARVEWEHIQRVLHDCEGNVSQAARVLGIHRRSLQRKLAKHPPPGE